jgi:peptide-methionine (R)-S-oxide reductase
MRWAPPGGSDRPGDASVRIWPRDIGEYELDTVRRTVAEWHRMLSRREYRILRKGRTERPWSGDLLSENRNGAYLCRGCGLALFRSGAKFHSGTGWPSFYEPVDDAAVDLSDDRSLGMSRTEVRCARCDSHLGHVFDDAPRTPTGLRYCINSAALFFTPE